MASKGTGMSFSRKSYRLTSDAEKSRVTGIVHEKLLNDYLHRIFSSSDHAPSAATSRKPLNFQNLPEHLDQLLHVDNEDEESQGQVEGRLGPSTVVLDHTGGFEGLLLVDDDLLGVIGHSNFGTIRSTTCVYKGKWVYEVLISSQGLMQIGWCTINCRFNQEEGVGDTHNSYAYDGNRVRKWNVTTTNYGKAWAAGDIVSCLIDLDDGTLSFCLNGVSLGTAFENLSRGLGMAYFPAISLSFKESVAFNFGSRPLRYPVAGYRPLQDPPGADLVRAQKLLGCFRAVLSVELDPMEGRLLDKESSEWQLQGQPTILLTLAHIFHRFAPLLRKVYLVEAVLMSFLLGVMEKGTSTQAQSVVHQILDLLWLFMEDYEIQDCLKQLMMSLLRLYRFSPIVPDLGLQIHYLRLTIAILRHEKSRKFLLSNVLFDVLRSVVFFYIKSPLRVEEAGLQELIPTTWWPHRSSREGKESKEVKEETAEERLRRRAYERGCQRLKKRIEVVEELQVQILKLLLNNKDDNGGEASRYIFLTKFRKFLQENASGRGNMPMLCPPEYMVCFLHRLISALRYYWDEYKASNPCTSFSEEAYIPPQVFYNGKVDYFDLQRLGGLLSHLRKTLKDDLASKANIVIDPLELQAATMDDLDEDEEPAPAVAQRPMQPLAVGGALPLPRPGWLSSPTLGRANRFLSTAAVSLMTPRRPLSTSEKVKVRTLSVEQRTREDIEGSHWNEGLLLGRPPEEPEQPLTENSLLEVLDGAIMMYNLSVHQQLGKMVGVSDDVNEYAMALRDTEDKLHRCPKRRKDILAELTKSQKVFSEKLDHLSRRLAWVHATVYSQIQQAAERLERNFVDSRQLKVCATCFDLSVSLLRVLEMTITLVPEIFLDWTRPTSEMLLRRLAQLLNQVLNRVTAERNLFDRVVTLRLPGLESVDHYPILVAVTGILVRLLVHGPTSETERATSVLLADPCFQLRSICYLLGQPEPPAPGTALPAPDRKRFSLQSYSDYISAEELAQVERMLAHLTSASAQAAAASLPTSEEDLCPICYAHPISAVFQPCGHKSCNHHCVCRGLGEGSQYEYHFLSCLALTACTILERLLLNPNPGWVLLMSSLCSATAPSPVTSLLHPTIFLPACCLISRSPAMA
ncbi:E3 ubiquitin-protein ligase RNF123 isoform X4 [Carlito syrichta]|uniref:RING-type E3 ubiquitin transferase n=1 Tax=Carlito syrichta TaxID=1868482 RepID=A0A3Q0E5D0_CARSF|nr:E3 ubiquitin-protein ligase RNF123 isoform X4 [Carlito syrichta]